MASKDKPKNAPGVKKGGTKSSRRSSRTIANKERGANTRAGKLERAAERRAKGATVVKDGKKMKSATVRDSRLVQSRRVATKRTQRQNFSKLSPAEKVAHREAGRRQFASA